jgi:hypothetical protein
MEWNGMQALPGAVFEILLSQSRLRKVHGFLHFCFAWKPAESRDVCLYASALPHQVSQG